MPRGAAILVGIVVLILLAPTVGVMVDRAPVSYANLPFPVEGPVVAGTLAPMIVTRCNHTGEPVMAPYARNLYGLDSGVVITLASGAALIPAGCETVTSGVMLIPPETPPGRYQLKGAVSVRGRFRDFTISWESAPFEVLPPSNTAHS